MGYRLLTASLQRYDERGSSLSSGDYLLAASRVRSLKAITGNYEHLRYEHKSGVVGAYTTLSTNSTTLAATMKADAGVTFTMQAWAKSGDVKTLTIPYGSILYGRTAYMYHLRGVASTVYYTGTESVKNLYTYIYVDNGNGRAVEYIVPTPLTRMRELSEESFNHAGTTTLSNLFFNGLACSGSDATWTYTVPSRVDRTKAHIDYYITNQIGCLALKYWVDEGDDDDDDDDDTYAYRAIKPGETLDASDGVLTFGLYTALGVFVKDITLTLSDAS
jgi:hypothetical protein